MADSDARPEPYRDLCSRCAKPVARCKSSAERIVCRDCRRASEKPYRDQCSRCGKAVQRGETSAGVIICLTCRRADPGYRPKSDQCAGCGKPVHRAKTSAAKISCNECRRAGRGPVRKRAADLEARPCPACGAIFTPKRRGDGNHTASCSFACSVILRYGSATEVPRGRSPRGCEMCGETYEPSYGGQRTCGRACGVELRRRKGNLAAASKARIASGKAHERFPSSRIFVRECARPSCGKLFTGRQRRRYCSPRCSARDYNATRRRRAPRQPTVCPDCLGPVDGPQRPGKRCAACRRWHRRAQRTRDGRAKKHGVRSEYYTVLQIVARDGLGCPMCGEPIDLDLPPGLEWSPVIEHRIPMCFRGPNVLENVQLSHNGCNEDKEAVCREARRGGRGVLVLAT
jgi:hypothetical protein